MAKHPREKAKTEVKSMWDVNTGSIVVKPVLGHFPGTVRIILGDNEIELRSCEAKTLAKAIAGYSEVK